jgi:hypothetical protein
VAGVRFEQHRTAGRGGFQSYIGIAQATVKAFRVNVSDIEITLDICPQNSYINPSNLAPVRGVAGDSRLTGRVRFLRAGLVTSLSGGPGIVPAGIRTGARGASLKRGQ